MKLFNFDPDTLSLFGFIIWNVLNFRGIAGVNVTTPILNQILRQVPNLYALYVSLFNTSYRSLIVNF